MDQPRNGGRWVDSNSGPGRWIPDSAEQRPAGAWETDPDDPGFEIRRCPNCEHVTRRPKR